jgi:hypothetical protein
MAVALAATALAQALVTLTALLAGLHATEGASLVDIVGINAMYVALWATSALLFGRAAGLQADAPVLAVPGPG